jgi:hypothetical protein
MNNFQELIALQKHGGFIYENKNSRTVFAPDLGARVFCELDGMRLHRLDIENIKKPDKPFNNYGGNNFWPAPEGGVFGFNYDGDQWRVQSAINNEPFMLTQTLPTSATAQKRTTLVNRKGTRIEVKIERIFSVASVSAILTAAKPAHVFAYLTEDSIDVLNPLKTEHGLISCWTLEQFDASQTTISFGAVDNPRSAINFDFYEHAGDRITYKPHGFFYKTDGQKTGQIGIRRESNARCIGFFDLARNLVCIREIIDPADGVYFNIADNSQPFGPYSAADNYSIFNGGAAQGFFEVETIGAAGIQDGVVSGSKLVSKTSFALFESREQVQKLIDDLIGI